MSKTRLGKGLDSLLSEASKKRMMADSAAQPSTPSDTATSSAPAILAIPVGQIERSPYQPRQYFDPETLEELAESIRQRGVLQPIVVRPHLSGGYELIAGERRWRAAQLAGLKTIPSVRQDVSDREASAIALIENIQREDLGALEEALGLERIRKEFDLTQQEVAEVVGKSRASIANSLRLLNLGSVARQYLQQGELEMGHARALLSLSGLVQDRAADQVVSGKLSVRETEALVKRTLSPKNPAIRAQEVDGDIQLLRRRLMDHLGAGVEIKQGPGGAGSLTIKYASLEELDGVLEKLKLPE